MNIKLILSIAWLAATIVTPVNVHGREPDRDSLFHIERNKNANIVQYDAQLGSNGLLDLKKPVIAYWVRLAEQGQVKKLTWIQRTFAFGFSTKLDKSENTALLDMKADIGRNILVKRVDEDYRAVSKIDGVNSYIDSIFIHASGKEISTRIDYIELYGKAVNNQADQYERFSP